MASSPEEYQQWLLRCTQPQLHADDDMNDKRTPQTQNSTPCNTSTSSEEISNDEGNTAGPTMILDEDVGYRQQQQQHSSYWRTPQQHQQERCFLRLLDDDDDNDIDCPVSLETTPHTSNQHRPKRQTSQSLQTLTNTTSMMIPFPTPDFCSPVAAVAMPIISPSTSPLDTAPPRVVMRDATNTSTEVVVESRALFPDSSDEDDHHCFHDHGDDKEALKQHHRQRRPVDPPHQQPAAASSAPSSTFASAMKNGPSQPSSRGIIMKSRRKNSPTDQHDHYHVLDCMVTPPASLLDQEQQHHRGNSIVHPLLYHERNPSVDSSLSTLSSLDSDSTFDGSAQTSPHPYRQSSAGILVVSGARKKIGVRRISTLAALTMTPTDSHSLPPPRYNNKNNNHYDLKHHRPTISTAFVDAGATDGATGLPLSSASRGGGAHRATTTTAKSLLRLAATNNGLLWIMCFMALTSASMTVLTSRIMSHEAATTLSATTLYLENHSKPGGTTITSGSVLFPPTAGIFQTRVLIPVHQQQQHTQQHALRRQPSATTTVVEQGKTSSRDRVEGKQGKPKQQPVEIVVVNQKEAATTTTKRRHAREEKTAATSNVKQDKHTKHKRKNKVDAKAKPTQIVPTFTLKPVQMPNGTIAEKRKEPIDHKIYRTSQSLNKGKAQQEQSHSRRIVYMHESLAHQKPKPPPRKLVHYPADFTDSTQLYSVLDSSDERVRKSMEMREPYVQGECVPMQDWQTTFHPSCNHVHALSLDRMGRVDDDKAADSSRSSGDSFELFGTKGFWRNAWKVQIKSNGQDRRRSSNSSNNSTASDAGDVIVLKTLKIQHQFEDAHFEHNRIDAVAMERLTSSPHVINIFGFCGHSVMTEYADGNRLGALADKSRSTPLARLRIARDIATGLADVHGIDGDGNTTFVHLDVNPANIVSIGGTLKLNDFNIGIIRRWNTTSNEPCGFPAQYPNPQWRSPEEARNELNLTEKVDVFSMGHIFFRLICGHEPWNKLEVGGKPSKMEMNEKVQQGIRPTIPASVLQSTDNEVVAIREAMLQCYKFNPKERPTARSIANALQRALDKLERKH